MAKSLLRADAEKFAAVRKIVKPSSIRMYWSRRDPIGLNSSGRGRPASEIISIIVGIFGEGDLFDAGSQH
jgi:hypothetical protein